MFHKLSHPSVPSNFRTSIINSNSSPHPRHRSLFLTLFQNRLFVQGYSTTTTRHTDPQRIFRGSPLIKFPQHGQNSFMSLFFLPNPPLPSLRREISLFHHGTKQ